MFVWLRIIDINNVEDQLDAKITIYWYSNQLNMFRAIFLPILRSARLCFTVCGTMHPSCCRPVAWSAEVLTMCSVWRMLLEQQQLACIIPQALKHSLALLRMGKILPETCWADWNINKLLFLHLVGLLHYLYQWFTVQKKTSNSKFSIA